MPHRPAHPPRALVFDSERKHEQWHLRFEHLRVTQLAWALEDAGSGQGTVQTLHDLLMQFVDSSRHYLELVRTAAAQSESDSITKLKNKEAAMQVQLSQIDTKEQQRKEQQANENQSLNAFEIGGWRQEQWRQRQQVDCVIRTLIDVAFA